MYKCTECNALFKIKPGYCNCGNDEFVEIVQQTPRPQPSPKQSQQNFDFDDDDFFVPRKKKQDIKTTITYIFFGLCVAIALFNIVTIFLGAPSRSMSEQAKLNKEKQIADNVKIPNIDQIWDNTLPKGLKATNPLAKAKRNLNSKMATLSIGMKKYVVELGQAFVSKWDRTTVVGDGSCEVEFYIDKRGSIQNAHIIKKSNNKTIDASINVMLKEMTRYYPPPEDYTGEPIIIAFSVKNSAFKVFYPNY